MNSFKFPTGQLWPHHKRSLDIDVIIVTVILTDNAAFTNTKTTLQIQTKTSKTTWYINKVILYSYEDTMFSIWRHICKCLYHFTAALQPIIALCDLPITYSNTDPLYGRSTWHIHTEGINVFYTCIIYLHFYLKFETRTLLQ